MSIRLWSDAMISAALRSLRLRTIREGRPGLEHVEALMALRGDNLAPVPRKNTIHFRRGGMRRAVVHALQDGPVHALQDGPLELREIVAAVYAGKVPPDERPASNRVANALTRLKRDGVVVHEGRRWRLAP